ncbi:MAG: hypothetical protein C5B49_04940 [Bdellovibrio sp.]|nr:MAG: hypothetical protein C5B49_04940 [Bdellovibrio sp.]
MAKGPSVTQNDVKGPRVLIVDDEPALREIIEQEFARKGWLTCMAGGGYEAFEILQTTSVEVVVSDVRMSKGSGIQLLDLISADPVIKPIVILISGYSEVDEYKAMKKGAAAFFLKPFRMKDFVDSVILIYQQARESA